MTKDYLITPFKYDHVTNFEFVEKGLDHKCLRLAEKQLAWSLFYKDKLVMIGGFYQITPWMLEAWACVVQGMCAHTRAILRTMKVMVSGARTMAGVRRIQATSSAHTKFSSRILEMLGFRFEGNMHEYGPNGETYQRYVILKGWD